MAILLHRDLLDSGDLELPGGAGGALAVLQKGRIVSVRARWRGHRLAIVNVYLQSGDAKAQASALAGPVQARIARAARDGDSVILAGDFNFTEHAQLDRAGWDRQRPEDPFRRIFSWPPCGGQPACMMFSARVTRQPVPSHTPRTIRRRGLTGSMPPAPCWPGSSAAVPP